MKMEKRYLYAQKHWRVFTLAALCAVVMIGVSWAYWSQEYTVANEFQLGTYRTGIVEEFESPTNWRPGDQVNKDVEIRNEGTVPVYVQVVLSQEWLRREDVYDREGNAIPPRKGEPFPLTFETKDGEAYAAQIGWGSEVVVLSREDGVSKTLGLPRIADIREAFGKWVVTSETPDAEGDYKAYYMGILSGEATTPRLIEDVRMHPDIEATVLGDHTVWDKGNQTWVTTFTNNPTSSYENAHYNLGVTMYTVQATKEALGDMFTTNITGEQEIINELMQMQDETKENRISADTEKKLFFEEVNGEMRYTPVTEGESWFMSHLNMMPGESYEDSLQIENRSKKSYDLYLQVLPRNQEPLPQELLEYIAMKVYQGDQLIYDGTALGKSYPESINDLQQVIPLGNYKPQAEDTLRVELLLHPDTPIEFAGILSNIDWKFMVEDIPEKPIPAKPMPAKPLPQPVKTGDLSNSMWYMILMGITGVILGSCVVYLFVMRKRNRKEGRT